jgi:hypothetical protein
VWNTTHPKEANLKNDTFLVSKPHVLVGPNEQQIAKSDNWQQYFPNFIISVKILAPPFTYIN